MVIINELNLNGLLSFGTDSPSLKLNSLNILIGPNGSGKSNLIEAIGLLRSSAAKLTAPLRGAGGGGVTEWLWKGSSQKQAHLEAVIEYPNNSTPLRHIIEFTESANKFELVDERIENASPTATGATDVFFYYRFQDGRPVLSVKEGPTRHLKREDVAFDESILSQRKDPDQYPELAFLSDIYTSFRIFREWSFGRTAVFRIPQAADLPNDRLEENYSNLGVFLNKLRGIPQAKRIVLNHLRELYDNLDDFDVRIQGGSVEVFLTEGDFTVPASRLSDGTLRYLCLLSILCDPDPPALICIEEPELGLHPDMIPKIADLMVTASERTQLVVSTHSDILVDAMTDRPDCIVVMEKHNGQTIAKRLEVSGEIGEMLESYRLGNLWLSGDIGGNRW